MHKNLFHFKKLNKHLQNSPKILPKKEQNGSKQFLNAN